MKKYVILCVLCISFALSSFAQVQEQVAAPESKSKAVEFLKADGVIILKEFYDPQKIRGVECQVLIMKYEDTGEKMGCLRLETQYRDQYSSGSYIGTLDSDELDACIRFLRYIKDKLLPTTPEVYTEAEYKTKDGVKLGAYFSKNKWTAFVYTKGSASQSACFLDVINIDDLIAVMEQAKALISEKTK